VRERPAADDRGAVRGVRAGSGIRALDSRELRDALRADDHDPTAALWRELDAHQQRADKLDDDFYVHGTITDERRYQRLRQQIDDRIRATRDALDRVADRAGRAALPSSSDEARQLWADRGLEYLLVEAVVDKIIVGPGIRGLNRFDHRRVVIQWRYGTKAPKLSWVS
jgi:hypothetical protein